MRKKEHIFFKAPGKKEIAYRLIGSRSIFLNRWEMGKLGSLK
jgi:hypothetical protein